MNLSNNKLHGPLPNGFEAGDFYNIYISNNYFTFDDFEPLFKDTKLLDERAYNNFSPQNITINNHDDSYLAVTVGGTLSNNVYEWSHVDNNNIKTTIRNDSTFKPKYDGNYRVVVHNKIVPEIKIASPKEMFSVTRKLCSALNITDLIRITTPHYVYFDSKTGEQLTDIEVNEDDYIFIHGTGKIQIGTYTAANGQVKILEGTPLGNDRQLRLSANFEKLTSTYRFGQVLAVTNGDTVGLEPFGMKGVDCDNIPADEIFFKYTDFYKEAVNYYIVKKRGKLKFILNQKLHSSNKGEFKLEIYKMTRQQHLYRNCFNKCPERKPVEAGDGNWLDHTNLVWNNSNSPFEKAIQNCYHCRYTDFRGIESQRSDLKGAQCVYMESGRLVNLESRENCLGSFDYGYWKYEGNSRLHFILDIGPHLLYNSKRKLSYSPTPIYNIY